MQAFVRARWAAPSRVLLALSLLSLAVLSVSAQAAKVYQWKDKNGQLVISDKPPMDPAQVETRNVSTGASDGGAMPADLAKAVKHFPVTLYATANCKEGCSEAKEYLSRKGIPHTVIDPSSNKETYDAAKKLLGDVVVPALRVGDVSVLKGYTPSEWDAALDAAGYPKQSKPLPSAKAAPAK